MSRDKAKKIRDPIAEALEHDAQHHLILHAYPSAGMSSVNVFWLLKLIETGKGARMAETLVDIIMRKVSEAAGLSLRLVVVAATLRNRENPTLWTKCTFGLAHR